MNKRTGTYLLSLIFLTTMLLSCQQPEEEIKHWSDHNTEISMSINNNIIMEYHPETWQTGFSELKFFAMHDELKSWFKLELDEFPVTGQKVDGRLTWKARSSKGEKTHRLSFKVVKTDDSGKTWLYNHSQRIGLIIGPMNA